MADFGKTIRIVKIARPIKAPIFAPSFAPSVPATPERELVPVGPRKEDN